MSAIQPSALLFTVILLLGLALPASPALAARCKIACKGGPCSVTASNNATPRPHPVEGSWTIADSCDQLEVSGGLVELRYLHRGRWFMPQALPAPTALSGVFKANPADTCSVVSPECLQLALSAKQAATGGHGIDNRVSKPGGEGDPCTRGLPCGSVLPRAEPITLRLADSQAQGLLTLRTARGQAAELQTTVQGGRASLDGNWLQPGGLYVYQYNDATGKPIASGEFSLLSASMAERLRQRSVQRQGQQGLSAAQAWYDTLLENQLLWDALQLDLGSEQP
jgi:hypothetical protein